MAYSIGHDQIHQIQHPCGLFNKPCSNTLWLSDLCGLHLCTVSISDELNWFQQFLLSLPDYFSSVPETSFGTAWIILWKKNTIGIYLKPCQKSRSLDEPWKMNYAPIVKGGKLRCSGRETPSSPSGLLCEQRFYTLQLSIHYLIINGMLKRRGLCVSVCVS